MAENLNEFIYKINKPCILKNILNKSKLNENNSASNWTFDRLDDILNSYKFKFRIGNKNFSGLKFF